MRATNWPAAPRNDAQRRAPHASPLVLARLAASAVTMAIPFVLTRKLSLAEYGSYKQVFLLFQSLGCLLPFGMAQSLYYFVPRERETSRYYVANASATLLAIGALTALAFCASARFLGLVFHNSDFIRHRQVIGVLIGLLVATLPLESALTSSGRIVASAAATLLTDVGRALALILPAVLHLGLAAMFAGVASVYGLRMVVHWSLLARERGRWWSATTFRAQCRYALPLGVATLLSVPQQYAHQFVVSSLLGPDAFAVYAVGCFQLPFVEMLYTPTCEVLMVRIGLQEKATRTLGVLDEFRAATGRLAYAFVPMALFCVVESKAFVIAAFGARFSASTGVFRFTALALLLNVLPIEALLRARNETGHILRCSLAKLAFVVPAIALGIHLFGVPGAAAAQLASECLSKGLLAVRSPAALGRSTREVILRGLPWGALLRTVGCSILAFGAMIATDFIQPHLSWTSTALGDLAALAFSALVFGITYLAALRWTGVSFGEVLGTHKSGLSTRPT